MKKIAFLILLIFSFAGLQAQVKHKAAQKTVKPTFEETIGWVIEKLNAYAETDHLSSSRCAYCFFEKYVYTYSPNSQSLVITYIKHYYDSANKYQNPPPDKKCLAIIPLKDITKVEAYKNDVGTIFGITINTYGKVIKRIEGDDESMESEFPIALKVEKEERLLERLQKAFADLRLYFPKKQEVY